MITLIVCIRRAKKLTRREFTRYWADIHGPLVRSVPQFMRHIRKYAQYHIDGVEDGFDTAIFGDPSSYDGVAMLQFDSREAMRAAFEEPRYLEIIRPDEANFIDAANCLSFITNEVIVTRADSVKMETRSDPSSG